MEIRKPAYYDAFRCIASACPDSCCKDWAVAVDNASAEQYRYLPGNLGDDLRRAMVQENGDTILQLSPDGRCPMWREDGLCRIQAQLGEAALCHTCRTFPRLRHDYGSFVELGLELSCPEAARLILTKDDRLSTATVPGDSEGEYDTEIMEILLRSRTEILTFFRSDTFSPGQMLSVLLLYGYAVQEELDGGGPALLQPEAMLASAQSLAVAGNIPALTDFFKSLEILTPRWQQLLDAPANSGWCSHHMAMAKYFINRYWLQAVSDYDLVCRVKLTVVSCLLVKLLGGDPLQTAQLYSKEIENNPDNVEAILDGAYTSPALADIRLLGLLLEDTQ